MSRFKIANLLTFVVLVLISSSLTLKAQTSSGSTREDCEATCANESPALCPNATTEQQAAYAGCVQGRIDRCKQSRGCSALPTREDRGECRSLYQSYQQANTATGQECAKSGVASVQACIAAANQCSGNTTTAAGTSENPFMGLMNVITQSNGVSSGSSTECTIELEANKKEEINEKIQRLRDEQADSVTEQADLDSEIADKEKEIKEEIRQNKDDINQSLRDLDKEDREKFSDIQKKVLEAQSKQFKNLSKINRLNTEIANLEFAQQQINIEFSESKIARKCRAKVMEIKDRLTGSVTPIVAAAPANPAPAPAVSAPPAGRVRYSVRDAQRIKKELREEEDDCLKTERLGRSAQLKGKIDRRQELTDQVSEMNRENEDEAKSIELDKQDYNKFKEAMALEKQQKLASIEEMEANLNASLTAFKALVDRKKAALQSKITNRQTEIDRLLLAREERQARYTQVSASLFARQEAQTGYTQRCCQGSNQDTYCRQLRTGGTVLEPVVGPGTGVNTSQ